jgi:hypothetical protein
MTILGYIFLALLAITVLGLLVMVVASLPDLRRYASIRRM